MYRVRIAAPLLGLVLAGCSGGGGDLSDALQVDLPDYDRTATDDAPADLCATGRSGRNTVEVGDGPGDPVAVALGSADGGLTAWGWVPPSADPAGAYVDALTGVTPDCDYTLITDGDSNGDGRFDTAGGEEQRVYPASGAGWWGVTVTRDFGVGPRVRRRPARWWPAARRGR